MEINAPELPRGSSRGQVGIETLIVFIAMILVAAIAASVLINTAGYLQNQASTTSQDSQDQVSNQVLVISSIGEINIVEDLDGGEITYDDSGSDDEHILQYEGDLTFQGMTVEYQEDVETWDTAEDFDLSNEFDNNPEYDTSTEDEVILSWDGVEEDVILWNDTATLEAGETIDITSEQSIGAIDLNVMQSPGAGEIDLSGASIEYIGPSAQSTLTYTEGEASATDKEFSVRGVNDPEDTAPVLTSREDRMTIRIHLTIKEDYDLQHLREGEDATIRIVTQSGSQAVTIVNVPQSLSSYDHGDAVEL